MTASAYFNEQKINWIKGTNYATAPTVLAWSLHTANPVGTGANEMTTQLSGRASYTPADFTAIATVGTSRQIKNTALINWGTAVSGGTATHWGLWDATSGGNFLFGGTLEEVGVPASLTFATSDPVTLAIDSVSINIDTTSWSLWAIDNQLNWLKGTTHPAALATLYLGLHNSLNSAGTGTEVTTLVAAARIALTSATAWTSTATVSRVTSTKNNALIDYGNSLNAASIINRLSLWTAVTAGNLIVYPSVLYPQSVVAGKPIYIPQEAFTISAS
jgi:hypothetical protein